MDSRAEATEPEPGRTGYRVVGERRLARRPVGRLWWALALVPVAATAVVGWQVAPEVESALHRDVSHALRAEGLAGVTVTLDGRQVLARVPGGHNASRVESVAGSVPGVMAVSTRQVYSSASEARACRDLESKMRRATSGQRILFAGTSTRLTPPGRQRLSAAADLLTACPSATALVGGHADGGVPDPGRLSLQRARVMVGALVRLGVRRAQLEPRGYGDQFELEPGSDPADRPANHRGSIVVTGR